MPLKPNQTCEVILLDDDEDDYLFLKQAFQAHSNQITLHHLTDEKPEKLRFAVLVRLKILLCVLQKRPTLVR